MKLLIKKLKQDGGIEVELPKPPRPGDLGLDLKLLSAKEVHGDVCFFHTGLVFMLDDPNYHLELIPRSSMSKTPFSLPHSFGLIDPTYRGEMLVPLRKNEGNGEWDLDHKTLALSKPLVQLIIRKNENIPQIEEVTDERWEVLRQTVRGEGGFGSTNAETALKP